MSLSDSRKAELRATLAQAIEDADTELGVKMAQDALAEGVKPLDFFKSIVDPELGSIGERFSRLEIFLPELMRAGAVVKAIQTQVLEPAVLTDKSQSSSAGTVVIGTALSDIHDIGKNMVALMLQVSGFKVIDLGTNIAPRDFIEAAKRENADIIAMSSLLTPSMPYIKDVAKLLEGYGLRDKYMLVAGGAPITQEWVESIGLDGFGEDAVEAVDVCRKLMATRKEKRA